MTGPLLTYRAHGYTIRSDVALPLPPATTPGGEPDLLVERGKQRNVPVKPPTGQRLATVHDDDRHTYYAFSRDDRRVVLRFFGAVDLVGDRDLTRVRSHADPGFEGDIVPVVAGGALPAVRLMLDGHLVLHASAVQGPDGAIAFVGTSGMGKSTVATVMWQYGLPVLTDDVLRVDLDGGARVWPGASELRLRPAARSLAQTGSVRTTVDGRLALAPELVPDRAVRLACVVVPSPRRDLVSPSAHRLSQVEALTMLSGFPRIVGWSERTALVQQFAHLAELVRSVPVVVLAMPWGPPFAPDAAALALDVLADAASKPAQR